MVEAQNIQNGRNSHVINEETSLLSAQNSTRNHGALLPDESAIDEDPYGRDIDPKEFDNMLSRSESINTGLGIEPISQETAMLRGPRRYSHLSTRRKSCASTVGSIPEGTTEDEEEEIDNEETKSKSPYLAGVSVARFWLVFGGILTATFVSCFDSTIMVSSHPVITSYFHSSNSASWLSTAFLLTSTAFQPIFGRLSDTIGRKTPYIFSAIVFLLATIWCALAQSMTSFILARAFCGLGAGGMMAMGSIITSDLVPIEIRGVYQSYINIVFGAGSSLGAALGGAIADNLGWRWEFGIQVPMLALSLFISYFTIPRKLGLAHGVERKTLWEAMKVFDFKGSFLLTSSVTFLILGLNLGGNVFPWSHPFVIASLVIFGVCAPIFVYVESRVPLPIMPLGLLSRYPRAGIILSNFFGAVVINAISFNIPLYFQAVLLESATSSGLHLLVPLIIAAASGTATGFLITWTRRLKWFLMLGVFMELVGATGVSLMQREMANWVHIVLITLPFIGQGFMFPSSFMAVLAVSEQAEQAVVTSTLLLWRSIGTVLGVASSSLVLQNALFYYLEQKVVGPDKGRVIQEVRQSVRAILDLEPYYREQVIDSYAASLQATFIMAGVVAALTVLLTLPLRLPRLGQRS